MSPQPPSSSTQPPTQPSPEPTPQPGLFARAPALKSSSPLPWIIAAAAVLLALAGVLLFTHHAAGPATARANTLLPPDSYAPNLVFSVLAMSESSSLSGGKSVYIDGHVRNTGQRTVTAATVQVLFANDENLPPQVESLPLTLIRTREPYVDTQPLAAAPLAPQDEREFRLIFENITPSWNQNLPQIHLVHSVTR